jgi:hypothetical protein
MLLKAEELMDNYLNEFKEDYIKNNVEDIFDKLRNLYMKEILFLRKNNKNESEIFEKAKENISEIFFDIGFSIKL